MGVGNKLKNTPKNTPKKGKESPMKSRTPQPTKGSLPSPLKKTPKSAPPPKRKKLSQEIDEEFSDEEFEELLQSVRAKEKAQKLAGKITPKKVAIEADDDDEDDDDDDDDEEGENLFDSADSDDDEDDDDEDDDDDDDDDESDSEELNDSEMSEILKRLTAKKSKKRDLEEVDDDDDDDDEDDSEGDDDEDSEEESEEKVQQPSKKLKISAAGPSKKISAKESPVKAPKKDKVKDKHVADAGGDKKPNGVESKVSKGQNDQLSLFVKNIPNNTSEKEIKLLCPTVKVIRLKKQNRKDIKNRKYAFLEFESEEQADKNFKLLQKKKIGTAELVVDYVGPKRQNRDEKKSKAPATDEIDPKKLFVAGFGHKMKREVFESLFPTASETFLPMKKNNKHAVGYGFVNFQTTSECKKVMAAMNGKEVEGRTLDVNFGKKRTIAKKRPAPQEKKKEVQAVKKSKTEVKSTKKVAPVEADDDEDDDEDDEDMDDDDDDDDSGDDDEGDDSD